MKKGRRALAVTLALALAASMVPTAFAEDSMPLQGQGAKGEHQPNNHGYRPVDIANWSPETDNYAEYTRGQVPLQQRIDAFAATQANTALSPKTQMAWVSGDYGNSKYESYQSNDNFGSYLFNFWQYTDLYAPWHGMPTAEYPEEWYYEKPSSPGFEGGTIYPPNPAYTNAAHKNGALSLACVFFPRPGQDCKSMLVKDEDGNYPVAEGMIKMAEYYGFDGYFFNQEVTFQKELVPLYKEFLTVLQEAGLYTQWYDSVNGNGSLSYQNSFNASNSMWIEQDGVRYNDSMFVNYAWDSGNRVQKAYDYANSIGVDPWQTLFLGMEFDKARLGGGHPSVRNFDSRIWGADGQTMASLALFRPEFVHACETDVNEQWKVFERERMLYSSPNQDPTNTQKDASVVRNDLKLNTGNSYEKSNQVSGANWNGVAHYITERSVISGSNFRTNFNTGHGMQYFKNGQVSNGEEWSNINIQDILPTWQWWIDTDGQKISVDFDYGSEYYYGPNNTYTQVGGYEGGSSLVASGVLDAENFLHLYKTDLSVNENSKISVTYNKVSADDSSSMEIGIIFKNSPDEVYTINVPNSGKQTDGWVTKAVSIDPEYIGEEIAAIGLNFKNNGNTIENYQMNIGEFKVTDGTEDTPEIPQNFSIEKMFDTKEAYVSWDMEDYDKVTQYNLYAELSDGKRVYLGGAYDSAYYIKNLSGAGDVAKLLLTAVSPNGYESEPAVIDYDFNKAVTGIEVQESAGYLDVSWNAPAASCSGVKLEVSFDYARNPETYETTVAGDAVSARVLVPVADGSRYTVSVSTVNEDGSVNKAACATGRLADRYSAPYDYDTAEKYTSTSYMRLEAPSSIDWWHMYLKIDGVQQKFSYNGSNNYLTRGKNEMYNLRVTKQNGFMEVILEDYRGNMSESKLVAYSKDFNKQISAAEFPDAALLQAVKEQAGDTVRDVMLYSGTLDLSGLPVSNLTGLSLMGNLRHLNLSGADVTTISAGMLGGSYGALLESIDLSGCEQLTAIQADAFKGLNALKEINLTGCTALETLNLNNSALERIVCEDPSALAKVAVANLSGSRFDLTAGTPEKAFTDALPVEADVSGQTPALYPAEMAETVRIAKKLGGSVNMQDNLEQSRQNAATVRGTTADGLQGADFLADGYNAEQALVSDNIDLIRVTDSQGNVTLNNISTSADGVYTVEYITYCDAATNGKAVHTQTVYIQAVTSVLEAVIENAQKLLDDNALENTMEAVVTEFNAALEAAKTLVDKEDATQAEINAATVRLLSVMAKVDWKQGDKTVLQVAVDVANTIKPNLNLYLEAGKQEFVDALAEAEAILASGNAWDDDIQAATARLIEAMSNLKMAANKDILNDMINKANGYNLSLYTAQSANAVRAALSAAEALAADENATQEAVDAAAKTLKAALSGLVLVNGSADDGNSNNGTTIPAGDGSAPTQTGDMGVSGLAALMLMSAAGVLFLRKKNRK